MRCGVTGLRPTFGRVPRTGAMTLCWSLDKLGPMTRSVEDAMLVLQAISGPDAGDVSSVPSQLDFDATAPACRDCASATSRVDEGSAGDRRRSRRARDGAEARHDAGRGDAARLAVRLAACSILFAEAAAAFEELTLSGQAGSAQGAGAGRVAEPLPPGALPLGGGLRAGGPAAAQGRAGDGAASSRRSICCSCRRSATRC